MKNLLLITLFIFIGFCTFSQSKEDKAKALETAREAIKLMDQGEIDKSIKLLETSQKLDPKNYNYPYEIGYAYYLKNDYKKAIAILIKVQDYEVNNDQCFTLLGNIYDFDKQPEKAIETYKRGLKKFPNSGHLYFELGNVQEVMKEYDPALQSWEKGLEVEPNYPSNYYNASIYFCDYTTEKIWGLMYGELFINLERGSKRTSKISEKLYKTYQSAITNKSDTETGISFSKVSTITLPKEGEEMKLPFSMSFEMSMSMSMAVITELGRKELGIASFNRIRTAFINNWFESKHDQNYPNILFDWHKKLIKLGHFEAYNYWLLMKGNEDEFTEWEADHKKQFEKFIEWFTENPMKIDEKNHFYRLQYN